MLALVISLDGGVYAGISDNKIIIIHKFSVALFPTCLSDMS